MKLQIWFFFLMYLISSKLSAQNVALNFDGVDDYVETKYMGISGSGARTIEAWVRTTANCDPNNGGKQKVICDYGSTSTGGRFTLNILYGNRLRIEVGGSGLMGQTVINDGKWHHVGVSYNPKNTSTPYKLYVDGKLDTAGNITTTINTSSSVPFRIGMRVDNTNLFEGDIDNVKFFNEALLDSVIKSNYKKEICNYPSTLEAYFKLNEGTAASSNSTKKTATEYIKANDGTLYNFSLTGSGSNWVTAPALQGGVSTSSLNAFDCNSYTSPSGKKYSVSGSYKDIIPNFYGCDSIITLKVTIGNYKKDINAKACDSFVSVGGIVYYNTGYYTEKYKTWRGCDSVLNYNLVINKSIRTMTILDACDSFINAKRQIFYQSGSYYDTLKTRVGCDSIIQRKVNVHYAFNKTDTVYACDTAWILGVPYTQSELITLNFKTSFGCDSIRNYFLVISNRKVQSKMGRGCKNFTSESGKVYSASGNYKEYFEGVSGCDSIVIYRVQLDVPYEKSTSMTGCKSIFFRDSNYTQTQWVHWTGKTLGGCDSTVHTYLNITTPDVSIRLSNDTLYANGTDQTLQWLNCQDYSMVPNQHFFWFKPSQNGKYAVEVNLNNCIDTSDCISVSLSNNKEYNQNRLIIIPNPSQGVSRLWYPKQERHEIRVYDLLGKEIWIKACDGLSSTNLPTLPSGRYQIMVINEEGKITGLTWIVM